MLCDIVFNLVPRYFKSCCFPLSFITIYFDENIFRITLNMVASATVCFYPRYSCNFVYCIVSE